jgi:tetratricopeptide (TPR) repeat protein
MSEIIPQMAIILSVAGILIILGRKIPAVLDLSEEEKEKEKAFQDREKNGRIFCFFKKIKEKIMFAKPEKSTARAIVEIEKILKKIRIQLLKLDQKFLVWIKKLREKSEGTFTSHNFQEKLGSLKAKKKTIRFLKKKEEPIVEKLDKAEKKEAKQEKDNSKQNKNSNEEKKCIEAITKNPKDVESYKKLGVIYLVQKNYKDAKLSFEQILKINSKNKKAKEELEKIEKAMK